jgi:hypothetical protein
MAEVERPRIAKISATPIAHHVDPFLLRRTDRSALEVIGRPIAPDPECERRLAPPSVLRRI